MELDDVSNGIFLRIPDSNVSAMSRHLGFHSTYNNFVEQELNKININLSEKELVEKVFILQQNLKKLVQKGTPLYPYEGASIDLWKRSLERLKNGQ